MMSAIDFIDSFRNDRWRHHTSVLFTVREEKSPDFTVKKLVENAQNQHAEIFVLGELQACICQNEKNYIVALFMSYTPCNKCSKELCHFLAQNPQISMEIHASRIYYADDVENQRGLCLLKDAGVSISMMKKCNYEECFQLFLSPEDEFKPWDMLDIYSEKNANSLAEILNSD